jgi:outer membrane protein, multidrug efflux system
MRILQWLLQTDSAVVGVILRIALAGVMFPHGAQKVLGWFGGQGFKNYSFAGAMRNCLIAFLVALLFAGCTVGPDYKRPDVPVPASWRTVDGGSGSIANLKWWQLFEDHTLQDLIRVAMENNKDLQVAVARVEESRALLGITRSAQLPDLNAGARYHNDRVSETSFPPIDKLGVNPNMDLYRADLGTSFEVDLWGRLRRATEAARAELLASEDNQRTVVMTLVAEVAQTYFGLLELDREAEIDRRTLASRRASLDLVNHRYSDGLASELDVKRAEEVLASAAATVPDAERQIAQTENRLRILLGENPGPIARSESLDSEHMLPEIPAGLPSALLEKRPDLRAAEERLVAANARIGEAKAEFFPQISLTGVFGSASVSLSDFFTGPSRMWSVGPSVTLPIFTAGRLSSNLHVTEARAQQSLIQYRQSIQQAFREVEDALVFHQKAREIRLQRERQVQAAEQALALANLRYTNGVSSYLDVLDTERQLFSAEIDLAAITRDQFDAVVQVYKALGGGWEADLPLGRKAQP